MAGINDDIKRSMQEAGVWKQFYTRRNELQSGEGMLPADARRLAIAEIIPVMESAGWRANFDSNGAVTGFTRHEISLEKALGEQSDDDEQESDAHESKLASAWSGYKEKFLGKKCTVVESVQWVAENLENPDPRVDDAPSAEAWGMLVNYQTTRATKDNFWNNVYTKLIPSKAQLPTGEVAVMDGNAIVDLLSKMIELKKESETEGEAEPC